MLSYQKGDPSAFATLVERHRRGVYHFAFRFLGSQDAAEDALQEVFLRVVKNASRYQRRAKFSTWLFTIARNYCIDMSRKARYRRSTSLSAPLGSDDSGSRTVEDTVAGSEPDPDRGAHNRRLHVAIQEVLAELGDEQREVFLLREHAGLPFKEIAKMTEVPENTVKSRMRYALEKLRDGLQSRGFQP